VLAGDPGIDGQTSVAQRIATVRRVALLLTLAAAACGNGSRASSSDQGCPGLPIFPPILVSVWPTGTLPEAEGPVEGPATVRQLSPFELVFDLGWSWSIETVPPSIPIGARVYARVEQGVYGLSSRGGAVTVWALRDDGTAGELAFATWAGSKYSSQDFGSVAYSVEPSDRVACGQCGQTLRVQQYRFFGGLDPYAFTGYAWAQERAPDRVCTDIDNGPPQAGRLERADLAFEVVTPPTDCAALDAAECPAHPECSLFGGDGVPMTCQRTLAGCERKDEAACVADTTCVWRAGAAGVPGACRTSCTTRPWPYGCDYQPLRFCQALDATDEACSPEAPGFCQRRPEDDCSDDGLEVCACSPGQAWALVSACTRAISGAEFVRTATACEM